MNTPDDALKAVPSHEVIAALEVALEAGPTPGEWSLWGTAEPSQSIAYANGFIAQTVGGNDVANATFIAAANPLAIRTLLDAHASALRDAERLRKALSDLLDDTQHSEHFCGDPECPVDFARAALDDNTKGSDSARAAMGANTKGASHV